MPCFHRTSKRDHAFEKPPEYAPVVSYSLTLAAQESLINALVAFRKYSLYERNPFQNKWQRTTGALVNTIKINFGVLNKSLADRKMRADRVDWYSEMVVEHKIAYNHPELINRLFEIDPPQHQ